MKSILSAFLLCTIIIATHDAEFARACAHRALTVEGGRVHVVS